MTKEHQNRTVIALQLGGGAIWIGGVYYVLNLVKALRSLPDDRQPHILLSLTGDIDPALYQEIAPLVEVYGSRRGSHDSPQLSSPKPWRRIAKRLFTMTIGGRVLRRKILAKENRKLGLDLRAKDARCLFPVLTTLGPSFPMPWIAWVYDLQHKYYPDYFTRIERQDRDLVFRQIAEDAPIVVTSSHAAANDFARFFPQARHKIQVLQFTTVPSSAWFNTDVATARLKYRVPEKYFLVSNQFWAHKNHRTVFEALHFLARQGIRPSLVCTGNTQDYRQPDHFLSLQRYLTAQGLNESVQILGLIPREDQIALMRGAIAVVQPSLFEGWSTVVEDARCLGKHIILSDIPVHREQDPQPSRYFPPLQPAQLAVAMKDAWDILPPGPDLVLEQSAMDAQKARINNYANQFLEIVSMAITKAETRS